MDVDCCLTCTSVIPIIIWLIALALDLFRSPFHICDRLTDGLPHALSSALLLFHARPWKHLPQSWHSFSSKGPTPSLSVDWWRHTPSDTRTVALSFLSDTWIPPDTRGAFCLFVIVDTRLSFHMATHTILFSHLHRRAPSSSWHRHPARNSFIVRQSYRRSFFGCGGLFIAKVFVFLSC